MRLARLGFVAMCSIAALMLGVYVVHGQGGDGREKGEPGAGALEAPAKGTNAATGAKADSKPPSTTLDVLNELLKPDVKEPAKPAAAPAAGKGNGAELPPAEKKDQGEVAAAEPKKAEAPQAEVKAVDPVAVQPAKKPSAADVLESLLGTVAQPATSKPPAQVKARPPDEQQPPAVGAEAVPPAGEASVTEEKVTAASERIGAQTLPSSVSDAEHESMVRLQAKELQGKHDLAKGEQALANKAYRVALESFLSAEDNLPKRLDTAEHRRRANEGAMISQYYLAQEKMAAGDLEDPDTGALILGQRAYARNRKFKAAERLVERIEQRIKEKHAMAERMGVKRHTAEDYIDKKKQAERWILEALEHIRVEEYTLAAKKLKMVLAVDENNATAIDLMKKVQKKRSAIELEEKEATELERIADVTDTWNARDYMDYVQTNAIAAVRAPTTMELSDEEKLIRKMESMTITEINFRIANIHDVIQFLVEASRDADKTETDPMKRGVNIVLNIGDTQIKDISFTARYVSLLEAIKIITDVATLKYRVEKNVVMIIPRDFPEGKLIPRFYPVEPTVLQTIEGAAAGGAAGAPAASGGAASGGGFVGLGGGAAGVGAAGAAVDLKAAFINMGVAFPQGSSIVYNRTIGKLIHVNTEENLRTFEKVFNELNVVPPQVQIETRFVDIAQTDLWELGLEYKLTDNWELFQQKNSGLPLGSRPRISMSANAADGGFTRNLRYGSVGASGTATVPASPIMAVQSILTNPEMAVLLNAIEQKGKANLLQAPKVTTQPGQEATVRVVKEYRYPTAYAVQGGAGAGVAGAFGVAGYVIPEAFETREVGVILTVLPEVSPNNNIITLTLAPEVVTDPEWHDYGYDIPSQTLGAPPQHIKMEMPFFHARSVSTTVKVYDGATVVMGGFISETENANKDRIPLLGDLPIIGRLFRSTHEQSEKRNLLIFVTARLLDPGGRAIRATSAEVAGGAAVSP